MELIPQKDYVLCLLETKKNEDVNEGGIAFLKENLPTYRIVKTSDSAKEAGYECDDVIVCDSTGTFVKKDGLDYYLFNIANIAGKILV